MSRKGLRVSPDLMKRMGFRQPHKGEFEYGADKSIEYEYFCVEDEHLIDEKHVTDRTFLAYMLRCAYKKGYDEAKKEVKQAIDREIDLNVEMNS